MASFETKIGWKWMREREKIKIIVLFRSYPTHNRKFPKNSQKIQKKKVPLWPHLMPKQVGKG